MEALNLHIQRLIRQGLTWGAGFLAAKGFVDAQTAESLTASGTEFVFASIMAVVAYIWSSINANYLKKKRHAR